VQPGPGSDKSTLAELFEPNGELRAAANTDQPPVLDALPTGQVPVTPLPVTGEVPTGPLPVTGQVPMAEAPVVGAAPASPDHAKPSKSTKHRRRWPRRVLLGVGVVLLVALGYYAVTLYQVWSTGNRDEARPVDAIVVLGAAQYDGRPAPVLASRLDHVLELYRAGYADTIVVTGGKQPRDRFTEAAASAKYLQARGVPASAILEETSGRTTYDSLRSAARLLHDKGKQRVLLVSDPYHMLRAEGIAEEVGLTAFTSPTRTSPIKGANAFRRMMKEAAGVSLARVIGFERLKELTG
jgi:uncharacterized SAM-binding protein YcdF (DUF218 family)